MYNLCALRSVIIIPGMVRVVIEVQATESKQFLIGNSKCKLISNHRGKYGKQLGICWVFGGISFVYFFGFIVYYLFKMAS